MRFLVKIEYCHEKANALVKQGKIGSTIKAILEQQKPEAAYFTTIGGKRGCMMVVDMKEASQLPAIAEPWFLALGASIESAPTMVIEDLVKAAPAIEDAVKKFGG